MKNMETKKQKIKIALREFDTAIHHTPFNDELKGDLNKLITDLALNKIKFIENNITEGELDKIHLDNSIKLYGLFDNIEKYSSDFKQKVFGNFHKIYFI